MKCDELKYEHLGEANKTYPASTLVVRKQYVDDAIAELKTKLEDVQATAYSENVDAWMRERKLKRALCRAKAEACMHKRWRTDDGFDYARSHRHMNKWLAIAEKFKEAKL